MTSFFAFSAFSGSALVLAAAMFAIVRPAFAAVPPTMNTQGVLQTNGGAPLADGTYELTFALYAGEAAPSPVWTETVHEVAIREGFYSAVLGAGTPFPDGLFRSSPDLWLGVTIGDGAELPRGRLLTVGYAFEADHAVLATTAVSAEGPIGTFIRGIPPRTGY